MPLKRKRTGFGLEIRTFQGSDEKTYIVFRTRTGSYHAFVEVEAKEAARECGAKREGTTRQMWDAIWNKG
jgi:hypothetical protein